MYSTATLLLAAALAFAGSAAAGPASPMMPHGVARAIDTAAPPADPPMVLVQNRGRGGGQRAAARGGNFNSNDFHRDVANSRTTNINTNRNVAANRNVNVNANRNVYVRGGCCNGNYDTGPNWGGVAAGVAAGAVVGAAATAAAQSNAYAAPPPTYPPGYVAPPPY
jgi:hypothetical protein